MMENDVNAKLFETDINCSLMIKDVTQSKEANNNQRKQMKKKAIKCMSRKTNANVKRAIMARGTTLQHDEDSDNSLVEGIKEIDCMMFEMKRNESIHTRSNNKFAFNEKKNGNTNNLMW